MKVLLHPGGALLAMAALAFAVRLFASSIPVIGGFVMTVALFAMIFGLIGGAFLTFVVSKGERGG
jgi:membrane associated rhomboid family serine protease